LRRVLASLATSVKFEKSCFTDACLSWHKRGLVCSSCTRAHARECLCNALKPLHGFGTRPVLQPAKARAGLSRWPHPR
jgi:hypothetical protein